MEVALENWMGIGGGGGWKLHTIAERIPMVCHGLALNLGGFAPLDTAFLGKLRVFLSDINVQYHTEHLSYCGDLAHLYATASCRCRLLRKPFTAPPRVSGAHRTFSVIASQSKTCPTTLRLAGNCLKLNFLNAVLTEADCLLNLDINNIYVNSINHGYDAKAYLGSILGDRIGYAHVAGHHYEVENLRIDTHGADVIDPVWELLGRTYELFGVFPTLLERDFDVPTLDTILLEVDRIAGIQGHHRAAFGEQARV